MYKQKYITTDIFKQGCIEIGIYSNQFMYKLVYIPTVHTPPNVYTTDLYLETTI